MKKYIGYMLICVFLFNVLASPVFAEVNSPPPQETVISVSTENLGDG